MKKIFTLLMTMMLTSASVMATTSAKPANDGDNTSGTSVITNGDFTGDDLSSFVVNGQNGVSCTSKIVANGPEGANALEIVCGAKQKENWDGQLFIVSNVELNEGDQYEITMSYRAEKSATISTQAHKTPGDYLHYEMLNPNPSFTSEWQTKTWQGTISASQSGMKSIAFNLNDCVEENTYYIANVKFDVKKAVFEEDPEGVTTIWRSETVFDTSWGVSFVIDASKFANAKVGDIIRVYTKDRGASYNPIFKNPADWSDMTELQSVKVEGGDYFEAVISEEALAKLQSSGLRFQGIDFTLVNVVILSQQGETSIATPAAVGTSTNGKFLENEKIVIVRNGVKYNVNGAVIK